jgi:hypothetical protein
MKREPKVRVDSDVGVALAHVACPRPDVTEHRLMQVFEAGIEQVPERRSPGTRGPRASGQHVF